MRLREWPNDWPANANDYHPSWDWPGWWMSDLDTQRQRMVWSNPQVRADYWAEDDFRRFMRCTVVAEGAD